MTDKETWKSERPVCISAGKYKGWRKRSVKAAAIFMVIILVVSVCGVGYLYMTSCVTVTAVGMVASEATAQHGTFDELKVKLAAGSATGTIYQAGEKL